MKQIVFGAIMLMALAAFVPLANADGYADYNITFDCFAFDPDSPDNAITTQTTRIMLGVEIKNNSKIQTARLVNVHFLAEGEGGSINGNAVIVNVANGTRVVYKKPSFGGGVSNITIAPGATYMAVCNTILPLSLLGEGKHILKARLFQVYVSARGYYVYNSTPIDKLIDVVR